MQFSTIVKGYYKDLVDQFDRALFEVLQPPLTELEIMEFTGSREGDRVHLKFHKPIQAEWISRIVEDGVDEQKAWFVDEGVQLPFGLTYWKHRHIVQYVDEGSSMIIDDISFKGRNYLHTRLLFPFLYFGFYSRKRVYKRCFGRP